MATSSALFQPALVGDMLLKHRAVMSPLTRYRASDAHVPHPIVGEYYAQRAGVPGTLIISEGTLIRHEAGGFAHVPGIWSDAQIARWKEITDGVHAKGSYIYLQLWALGRCAVPGPTTPGVTNNGYEPGYPYDHVSASNIPMSPSDPSHPRPLTVEEIQDYIRWYAIAAKNAVERAGFDGVELHGANGYLIDQFLQDVSNVRTDQYGGSVENRTRFALEIVDAVVKAVGPSRTGIRLSPWNTYLGMGMEDPKPTFSYLVQEIKNTHPTFSYIHVIEPYVRHSSSIATQNYLTTEGKNDFLREIWTQEGSARWFISAGGHNREIAMQKANEKGVLIAFGRPFLANPDLLYRLEHDLPLNEPNRDTIYLPDSTSSEGYTDYPFVQNV